jgi:hypothetical protein
MNPSVEQIRKALQNTRKPPRNPSEDAYKALQHVRLSMMASKIKPAALAEASGPAGYTKRLRTQYGTDPAQSEG